MNEINEYKAAFSLFDDDNDGLISCDKMKKLIRSLGKNLSENKLTELTRKINEEEGESSIEFHKFLEVMATYIKEDEDSNELLKAFKYFDHQDNGTIDYEEFEHVLSTVSEKLNDDQIEKLRKFCGCKKGSFNYRELLNLILHS